MIPLWFRCGVTLAGLHYQLSGGSDKDMKETYYGHKIELIRGLQNEIDGSAGRPAGWIATVVSVMAYLEVSVFTLHDTERGQSLTSASKAKGTTRLEGCIAVVYLTSSMAKHQLRICRLMFSLAWC